MNRSRILLVFLACCAVVSAALFFNHSRRNTSDAGYDAIAVADFLGATPAEGFSEVHPGLELKFPRDHGAHPDYRQEWWYFTGNLTTDQGRPFGFQLTFFRFGHLKMDEYVSSAWSHGQTWMAHFAVSDIDRRLFFAEQDYARGSLGLAGAIHDPFAVWVNGWSVRDLKTRRQSGFGARLNASTDTMVIELDLDTGETPVLQGDEGYSIKAFNGGAASLYYSYPSLTATGSIQLEGRQYKVNGKVWMDREWSTSVLGKQQSGWDWFALRLDDGSNLMLFQVRHRAGKPFRYAIVQTAKGALTKYTAAKIELQTNRYWNSPKTGVRYPLEWKLSIDQGAVEIDIVPAFADQELDLGFRYWEGAVFAKGIIHGKGVSGEGYMELTGYETD